MGKKEKAYFYCGTVHNDEQAVGVLTTTGMERISRDVGDMVECIDYLKECETELETLTEGRISNIMKMDPMILFPLLAKEIVREDFADEDFMEDDFWEEELGG